MLSFPFSVLNAFKSFIDDRRGSVAAIWAAASLTVLIAIGGAVDYSATLTSRGFVQNALDSAVLAAVQNTGGINAQTKILVSTFRGNLAGRTGLGDTSTLTPTLTAATDGSIVAKVTVPVPTHFMQIAGFSSVPTTVTSQAVLVPTPTPTTATFTMRVAKGWYWKRLRLYVVNSNNVTQQLAEWIYQPFNQNYAFSSTQVSNLSWPMTNSFTSKGSSSNGVGTLTGPTAPITLGLNYKDAYLTMEVDTDGCNLTQVVDTSKSYSSGGGYNPLYCKDSTAKAASWVYATNTKVGVTQMVKYGKKADGTPDGNNRTLFADKQPFQVLVPCTTPVSTTFYGWEDTNGATPNLTDPNSPWSTQDFVFSVTANTCDPNQYAASTRLTK